LNGLTQGMWAGALPFAVLGCGLVIGGCADERFTVATLAPDIGSASGFRGELDLPGADAATEFDDPVQCVDFDGDGFGEGCPAGPDCNDAMGSAFPGAVEQCGDGADNDCDGQLDEGCGCTEGESTQCYSGPPGTAGVGRCRLGRRVCFEGVMGPCPHRGELQRHRRQL